MKKKIIYGLLVIIWMAVIFSFSNQTADNSTNLTVGLLDRVLSFLHLEDLESLINILFTPVRKMAHYIIYLILGLLILNFIKEFDLSLKEMIIASLLICIMYAVSDEIHQIYVAGRAGRVIDVFIDTLGSITGIYGYYFFRKSIFK